MGQSSCTSAPPSPQPRSSHQAVMYQGHMYVFGGEFTSPNQEKFKTYRYDTLLLSCSHSCSHSCSQSCSQSCSHSCSQSCIPSCGTHYTQ